jgi:uncharacterized membrane protein YidH (DUF202 family)
VSFHSPELRESLANERNGLAWQRTSLSWMGSGAAVTRYFADDGLLRAQTIVGWLMLAVGGSMWLGSVRRYHRNADAIRDDVATTVPLAAIRATWIASVIAIGVAIATEISSY